MKHYLILACSVMLLVSCQNNAQTKTVAVNTNTSTMTTVTKQESIHQFKVTDLYGKEFDFATLKGKKILIVNTASECGLTPQYKDLEAIYSKYKDKGLLVIGFPSNDFRQELSDDKKIGDFCKQTYAVKFPMISKSSVSGANANPFYKQLAARTGQSPSWNFFKYVVLPGGKEVYAYTSDVKPDAAEILGKIKPVLK